MRRHRETEPDPSTGRAAPLDPLAVLALEIIVRALLEQYETEKARRSDGHA